MKIFTSSSVLLNTDSSKQWLDEQLFKLGETVNISETGISGDSVADRYIRSFLTVCHRFNSWWVYDLDGKIWKWSRSRVTISPCTDFWILPSDRRVISPKRLPFCCSEAMINQAPSYAICHAFIAPWSKTHGPEFTLELAERKGLKTVRYECPKELGPNHE